MYRAAIFFFLIIFPILGGFFEVSQSDFEPVMPFVEGVVIFFLFGMIISIVLKFFFASKANNKTKMAVLLIMILAIAGTINHFKTKYNNSYYGRQEREKSYDESQRQEAILYGISIHDSNLTLVNEAMERIGAKQINDFKWPVSLDTNIFNHLNKYVLFKVPENELGASEILFQFTNDERLNTATYFFKNPEKDFNKVKKNLCKKYIGYIPKEYQTKYDWRAKNDIYISLISYKQKILFGNSVDAKGFLSFSKRKNKWFSFVLSYEYKRAVANQTKKQTK